MASSSAQDMLEASSEDILFLDTDTTEREPFVSISRLDRTDLGLSVDNFETTDSLELRKKPQKLTVFGYYRLFLYGRHMTQPYPDLEPFDRLYGVGDGYREPMLSLNVLARPNGRSSFGTELFFFTPYFGTGTEDNVFEINLGINFYGKIQDVRWEFRSPSGWYSLVQPQPIHDGCLSDP